jgi:hypothetical protein
VRKYIPEIMAFLDARPSDRGAHLHAALSAVAGLQGLLRTLALLTEATISGALERRAAST